MWYRFSWLLLEPGECYFEEFSSYFGDDERAFLDNDNAEKLISRFKVCSKSVVFNPRDISKPIIKMPFKDGTEIKKAELGLVI